MNQPASDQKAADQQQPTEDQQPPEVTTREGFAELMARKRAEQQPPPEPDEPEGPEPGVGEGQEPESQPEGGQGEDQQPEGEQEEAKLGVDGDPDFKRAGKPPESEVEQPDLSDAPENIKGYVDRLQQERDQANLYANTVYQNYSALQGRLAPMQRKVEDLRREKEELEKQLRNGEGANLPSLSLEDLDSNSSWKEVSEEFPDEAKELRKHFMGKESELQQARQQLQQLQEEQGQVTSQFQAVEMQRLKRIHPDADEIRQHPRFSMWIQQIANDPQADQELVRKISSPLYEDAADVLSAFKRDHGMQPPPQQAPAQGQDRAHQGQVAQPSEPEAPAREGTPPPHQGQAPARSRQGPPPPAPSSQGAGVSGAGRGQPVLSEREHFRKIMRDKQRRNQVR